MYNLPGRFRTSKCAAVMRCPHGCEDLFTHSELNQHEDTCISRSFLCPRCLMWKGKAKEFRSHVNDSMLQPESIYFPLMSTEERKIIKSREEFYVFISYYDRMSECLWVSVKYMGAYSYAQRRYFKMHLKRTTGEEHQYGQQVQPAFNWNIEPYAALEIPLKASCVQEGIQIKIEVHCREPVFPESVQYDLLQDLYCPKCKAFMNGPIIQNCQGYVVCQECIVGKLGLHASRNLSMESLSKRFYKIKSEGGEFGNRELLEEIECSICLEHMCEPIRTCISGHSICNYCRSKLTACPLCRQTFNTYRNFYLESVTNRMHYKCMYAENGCTVTELPDVIYLHECKCSYGSHRGQGVS